MNAAFRPDEDVRKVAEAYSLDAVDFARDRRRVLLDWTDESVERIETLLAEYRSVVPVLKPSDEEIFRFAKAAGSYLGETFRRNHAGTWGMVTISGESVPGMMAKKTGELFWPWGRA